MMELLPDYLGVQVTRDVESLALANQGAMNSAIIEKLARPNQTRLTDCITPHSFHTVTSSLRIPGLNDSPGLMA